MAGNNGGGSFSAPDRQAEISVSRLYNNLIASLSDDEY
jgi:hypothetical protein